MAEHAGQVFSKKTVRDKKYRDIDKGHPDRPAC